MAEALPNTEPTKKCGNCERDIEASKFRMHEIGCARNNYKCQVCGEIVAKTEKEEHDKEAHTKVPCQYCKAELERKNLLKHENACEFKPRECRYCEQTVNY